MLKRVRLDHERFAGDLERIAALYRGLGRLEVDPHGERARDMRSAARSVVRRLVEDFV